MRVVNVISGFLHTQSPSTLSVIYDEKLRNILLFWEFSFPTNSQFSFALRTILLQIGIKHVNFVDTTNSNLLYCTLCTLYIIFISIEQGQ